MPIQFTRLGLFYVLFSVGVGAAAINTGNNLLYLILGLLLGFIVLSGFLSDSALWGCRATWTAEGSLYAGRAASFLCRAAKGWFPGVAITVEAEWPHGVRSHVLIPWIPMHGESEVRVSLVPPRR